MAERLAVYALTAPGAALARRLAEGLGASLCLPRRLAQGEGVTAFEALGDFWAAHFHHFTGHVVIGAAGLVVRLVAPLLVSKKTDPAVVVVTPDGRHAVSLLSGHLGGGNALARRAAAILGGEAVISTATDAAGCPALELVAQEAGLAIEDFARLPAVSRALVEGTVVKVHDPHGYLRPYLTPWPGLFEFTEEGAQVRVDYRVSPADGETLALRPPALAVGLGCHRGIGAAEVRQLVAESFAEAGLAEKAIALFATVETRAAEPALLEISRELGRPLRAFTKVELAAVATPHPSTKVFNHIGVPSVCEAAAMLAAKASDLIITKRKGPRATLAAALISSR